MPAPRKRKRLLDTYRFPGFRPEEVVKGVFGDPDLRVVRLRRKKRPVPARVVVGGGARSVIGTCRVREIFRPVAFAWCWSSSVSA